MKRAVRKLTLRDTDLRERDLVVNPANGRSGLWLEQRIENSFATLLPRCEAARLHRWLTRYLRQTKRYER